MENKEQQPSKLLSDNQIITLADLYTHGLEVFDDTDRFTRWMHSPIRALGFQTPVSLISTPAGIEEVNTIIGRIEYGIYS